MVYRDSVDTPLIRWVAERPRDLLSPVLIGAFTGWNDAGEAASGAVTYLADQFGATCVARADPEQIFDFQSHRPRISIVDGSMDGTVQLPALELWATPPEVSPGLLLVRGPEPSLRWPSICNWILDVAETASVTHMVTLGALIADVPHTRPVRVSAISTPREISEPLGNSRRPDYHGPAGITSMLHGYSVERGIPSLSLWAAVPHYIGGGQNPDASLTLLHALNTVLGIRPDYAGMEQSVADYRRQIEEAVASSPQASAMIDELERTYDAQTDAANAFGPLPSGDAIAAEFERFLREQSPPGDDSITS